MLKPILRVWLLKRAQGMDAALLFVGVFLGVALGLYFLNAPLDLNLPESYMKNMRPYLFTGFFTIGGFLLSLKTFILIQLKKELYDNLDYQKRVKELRAFNEELSLYGPLIRIGKLIVYCVVLSLAASMLQFSVGFIDSLYASITCISFASATLGLVLFLWTRIKITLDIWFETLTPSSK